MIIRFDTEQGGHHVWKSIDRITKKLQFQKQPDNYKVFALRPFTAKERVSIIEMTILKYQEIGIELLIIDGISDLVNDINNLDECSHLVSKLLKWSQELNCHILSVLHENPGSEKLRGHLGTEAMNKAETVLGVEKIDSRVSVVSGKYTRNGDFPPFEFEISQMGIPEIIGLSVVDKNRKRKSNKPDDYSIIERIKIAVSALGNNKLNASELNTSIINEASKQGIDLSDKPARLWIDQLEKDSLIINTGTRNRKQYVINSNHKELKKLIHDGLLYY